TAAPESERDLGWQGRGLAFDNASGRFWFLPAARFGRLLRPGPAGTETGPARLAGRGRAGASKEFKCGFWLSSTVMAERSRPWTSRHSRRALAARSRPPDTASIFVSSTGRMSLPR